MANAIPPLETEADYDQALAEIETCFDNEPKPGTARATRFDALSAGIERYESRYWPIEPPPPDATHRKP